MLFDDPATLVPDQILEWSGFCSYGLNQTRALCREALPKGIVPPQVSGGSLMGLSASEIDEYFEYCQLELDLFTILALVASSEARIRMDAEVRQKTQGNQLSTRLSILFGTRKDFWKVPL